jgi:hypothetical protein
MDQIFESGKVHSIRSSVGQIFTTQVFLMRAFKLPFPVVEGNKPFL